ncbi:MAG: D-glycerate dehydrogenase [Anaerolineales bacterium]|nr:D-glycerate dehydrogenase [Anaerolineales bacterium]
MTKPLVLLSSPLPAAWISALNDRVRLKIGHADAAGFSDELMRFLPEAAGILSLLTAQVTAELLEDAPQLRVVSNMAVGVDNIDVAACTRRGIPLGHTPGVLTDATADLTLAILLAAARRLPESARDAREGRWGLWSPTGWLGADLRGARLGIVGMGKIGRAVARRAHGFGLRLAYAGPTRYPKVDAALDAQYLALDELLRTSDFVSLHCPLNKSTRGLIDASALRLMKPNAILINAARGPVVDSAALLRALREDWIAAAALDVTDPEPLPSTHPLYALPNCLIVPHIGSAAHGTRRRMAELACENLLAGLAGERLPHCFNPEVYRVR